MAEKYLETTDPIELCINEHFDGLVLCVNNRRVELLSEYREKRDQRESEKSSRMKIVRQLTNAKELLSQEIIDNSLHETWEKLDIELETKKRNIEMSVDETEILFECETRDILEAISQLGQVVEITLDSIPDYSNLESPRISVCKRGNSSGELEWPQAIAYDDKRQHIFVVDRLLNPESGRICVFSVEGEYLNTVGQGELERPVGIAVSGDEVYVSDVSLQVIFHFKLPDFILIAIVGRYVPGKDEFYSPGQLTVANDGDVYIADRHNNRIVVLDCELKFKHSIKHDDMTTPKDIKILKDKLYVLSWSDNPCLHVFRKNGEKIRSLIPCGLEDNDEVRQGHYFCFDQQNNILISDYLSGAIKVFSKEGAFLHIIGNTHDKERKIKPKGIFITPSNRIVCASDGTHHGLHIFF